MHLNLSNVTAIASVATAGLSIIWQLAESKRKLENQFQANEQKLELTRKDLDVRAKDIELQAKDFFLNTTEIVSDLGSQVDKNAGAISAFKALRSGNYIVEDKLKSKDTKKRKNELNSNQNNQIKTNLEKDNFTSVSKIE